MHKQQLDVYMHSGLATVTVCILLVSAQDSRFASLLQSRTARLATTAVAHGGKGTAVLVSRGFGYQCLIRQALSPC